MPVMDIKYIEGGYARLYFDMDLWLYKLVTLRNDTQRIQEILSEEDDTSGTDNEIDKIWEISKIEKLEMEIKEMKEQFLKNSKQLDLIVKKLN